MVGDLLLQTGLKGRTEECTVPNWAVSWGADASFFAAGLLLGRSKVLGFALPV